MEKKALRGRNTKICESEEEAAGTLNVIRFYNYVCKTIMSQEEVLSN